MRIQTIEFKPKKTYFVGYLITVAFSFSLAIGNQPVPVPNSQRIQVASTIIDHEYTDETDRGEDGIDADERSY